MCVKCDAFHTQSSLEPAFKYFGGDNHFLLRLFLKELTVFAFLISIGRLLEGNNELKNIFV